MPWEAVGTFRAVEVKDLTDTSLPFGTSFALKTKNKEKSGPRQQVRGQVFFKYFPKHSERPIGDQQTKLHPRLPMTAPDAEDQKYLSCPNWWRALGRYTVVVTSPYQGPRSSTRDELNPDGARTWPLDQLQVRF